MTRTRTRCAQSPCTTSFYISPRSPYISAISLSRCAQSPCTIRDLPAGTNALVKVNAWGQAGEGEPSEFVAAQTEDSDYSRECRETLLAKADGSYVAPGTIVAAVFGGLAFLCLCGGVAYYFKRQKDSNVPPPPKAPGAAY